MPGMRTPLRPDQFVKSHALGNDYIVLDEKQLSRPLTPEAVRRVCDTHYGIGSDGILLLTPGVGADFGVRIFNPDGGEAEKSGNGLRILAKFLYDHGYTEKPEFTLSTLGGAVRARLRLQAKPARSKATFSTPAALALAAMRLPITSAADLLQPLPVAPS
jgi:diaminopimelate epimerase